MKINKEFKYNFIIAIVLITMDLLWNEITQNKYSTYQFKFPYVFLEFTSNFCFYGIYAVNYLVFAPRFLVKKKLLLYGISFLGMILLFAGTRYLLEEIILFHFTGLHNYNLENPRIVSVYLFDSFYYTLRFCLYSSIVYLLFRFNENKDKLHTLSLEHQKAQLTTLKSQISPHFLFNTLNNFYVELYDEKPETANDILKLSHLLRYVTYEAAQDFMPLEKELVFINDYLHFFKRRYEDNFHVELQIHGTIKDQKVPSLILIHFIENVCKHGIINDKNRIAKIKITIQNNQLEVITTNHINTSEKYMDSGIGTDNIEKRLKVLFKNNYTLEYQKNDAIFKTVLKLPI